MSPGPANETYFEHAYIARYLGIMLLEGEDLTIVNGKVMVRTVAGLKPVSVLWRRLDAAFADPLELDQNSYIGTPGMVQALRNGAVTFVNALGSGILETRALLAFMPTLSRHLLGEELKLPSIATWWCGQKAEREHVAAHLDRMVIGSAFSRLPFFDDGGRSVMGSRYKDPQGRTTAEWLETEAGNLVGQEVVTLSTTPAIVDGKLTPRPMSLRVFAARTKNGWQIMPGGFARIGSGSDVSAIAMQAGGSAADVWIVSDKPVDRTSLLPAEETFTRNMPGSLPSRAADNLFWLGRYIERAEGVLRILRAWHARYAESANPDQPLLAFVSEYLSDIDVDTKSGVPESLLRNIDSAVYSASNIRDRFSPDGWLALNDLSKTAKRFHEKVKPGDDAAHAMTILLRKLAGFAGLVHENMYRFTGWRFLTIGRLLERGLHMTRLLGHMTGPDAPDGALDMLLEIGDNVMTHRRRYNVSTARPDGHRPARTRPAQPALDPLPAERDPDRGRAIAERHGQRPDVQPFPRGHAPAFGPRRHDAGNHVGRGLHQSGTGTGEALRYPCPVLSELTPCSMTSRSISAIATKSRHRAPTICCAFCRCPCPIGSASSPVPSPCRRSRTRSRPSAISSTIPQAMQSCAVLTRNSISACRPASWCRPSR